MLLGAVILVPIVYVLLAKLGADVLAWVLGALFVGLAVMLLIEGIREGAVPRDKVIAMLIIFVFNILFWMFFEQAGSSFNFLAEKIVNRMFGDWEFPVAWFQSVNSIGVIALAPLVAMAWVALGKRNREPSIPRKFGLGLIGNGIAFLLLMYALTAAGRRAEQDSVLDLVHGLHHPVGRRAVPVADRPVDGDQAGAARASSASRWAAGSCRIATGNNLSGIFASAVSGESGMTTASALSRLHVRLLGAGRLRRAAVPDRAADQQADARREMTSGCTSSRAGHGWPMTRDRSASRAADGDRDPLPDAGSRARWDRPL